MNNLVHLNPLDPIFNEYEAFLDKSAGLKTIAFKYFGADIKEAIEYLEINIDQESTANEYPKLIWDENIEYYQPALIE